MDLWCSSTKPACFSWQRTAAPSRMHMHLERKRLATTLSLSQIFLGSLSSHVNYHTVYNMGMLTAASLRHVYHLNKPHCGQLR